MTDTITITLPRIFLDQLIDDLDAVIEHWQATADVMESGYNPDDIILRECSSPREAKKMAKYYTRIREHLESQLRPAQ